LDREYFQIPRYSYGIMTIVTILNSPAPTPQKKNLTPVSRVKSNIVRPAEFKFIPLMRSALKNIQLGI